MAYTMITSEYITDHMIKNIVQNDDSYFDRADLEFQQLCAEFDVDAEDVPDELPHRVKEWLKCWVCWQVCIDNECVNTQKMIEQGVIDDPYTIKRKAYEKMEPKARNGITKEILEGEADTPVEFTYRTTRMVRRS